MHAGISHARNPEICLGMGLSCCDVQLSRSVGTAHACKMQDATLRCAVFALAALHCARLHIAVLPYFAIERSLGLYGGTCCTLQRVPAGISG